MHGPVLPCTSAVYPACHPFTQQPCPSTPGAAQDAAAAAPPAPALLLIGGPYFAGYIECSCVCLLMHLFVCVCECTCLCVLMSVPVCACVCVSVYAHIRVLCVHIVCFVKMPMHVQLHKVTPAWLRPLYLDTCFHWYTRARQSVGSHALCMI
jgi:hypothetical protein